MSRQAGFTTVELLVAMVIGLVTTLAGFQALDSFAAINATVTKRSDNAQRARQSMDSAVRALRSQVCLGPAATGLLAGTPSSIDFVTDLSDGTVAPERRVLSYDATTRRLRDARYAGTRTATSLTFAASPTTYGPELEKVEPDGALPLFGYWAYDTADPPRPTLALPTPLSDADRGRVSRITVSMRVGPATGERDRNTGETLRDEILLRSVDPSDPVPLPLCS